MRKIIEKRIKLGDKEGIIRVGEYAHQANGSVTLQVGDTVVHAVATMGRAENGLDFFPLQVEYKENLYAAGKLRANKFVKRQGRPSDEAILKGRLIDRSIRPMFPKDFAREVQVILTILSTDCENQHDVIGLTAISAALAISDIPYDCNLAGVRVAKIDGKIAINPTFSESDKSEWELVLGGNEEKIVMIECAANEASDDDILEGFRAAFKPLGEMAKTIKELQQECGKKKIDYADKSINEDIYARIEKNAKELIGKYYDGLANKTIDRKQFDIYVETPILNMFTEEEKESTFTEKMIKEVLDYIFKKEVRNNILKHKKRLDGRRIDEIREIEIDVGVLPRVHGSSMFMRGETQVLSILTLGVPGDEQVVEFIEREEKKSYMHEYNALPFSVGETGRFGTPGRREIGHGALAEKALLPVIPSQDEFPYVIRLVSEVMGQNGSSSMASTCASTLSLLDAGVPIKAPVAGISVGLITGETDDEFVTITDIQGQEDFSGDMDFKVAGSYEGITAIQMDTKIKGLTYKIVEQSIKQAHTARNELLDKIKAVLPKQREAISEYAPRIEFMMIPENSIAAVIGSGGKVIKQLTADYGVDINIEDSGRTSISGVNFEQVKLVKNVINGIVNDPDVGAVYTGKIVKIMDFGAFVEIFPGKEGLIHISRMSKDRVAKVTDVVKAGQQVQVKLFEIDSQRRLNFTMVLDDDKKQRREVQTDIAK